MVINAYLVINNRGAIRVIKNRPGLSNNEIAVKLEVDVPREFFERLIPTVKIDLPKEAVIDPSAETVLAITAGELAENLKITYSEAHDGLKDMLAKARGEDVQQ